jgi:phosphatidylserine/phosphatidylglycerophosphate/cardiolipin synthase-like enzyme
MLRTLSLIIYLLIIPIFWAKADSVLLLPHPQEAAKVRLDLIANTKKEILISNFIFKEDRVGLQLMASLYEAAKTSHLNINLLVGGLTHNQLTQKISPALIAYLAKVGIKFYTYHPVNLLNPASLNARLHDKLFQSFYIHICKEDSNEAI